MRIRILDAVENFEKLLMEVNGLIQTVKFSGNQIICQNLVEGSADWTIGIGKIEELKEKQEKKYKFVNPSLKGSCIESLIHRFGGFRTRIMLMNPKNCYSVHADPTPRIHIPIITDSSQCWMIWPYDNECHRMPLGMVYWADTTKKHTFINSSESVVRVHLIMST